jgi:tetratricopeptide (TPR) repeat protein
VRAPAAGVLMLMSLGMIVAFLGNGSLSRAESALSSKSYATAVDDANRARRLMPWSPWPLIARGDAELGQGEADAAAASYRHAISIDPGEWRAWFGLAFATTGRERRAAFDHALRLYPTSAELKAAAARLKVETKDEETNAALTGTS